MSTYNICFHAKIRKKYLSDTHSYTDLWDVQTGHMDERMDVLTDVYLCVSPYVQSTLVCQNKGTLYIRRRTNQTTCVSIYGINPNDIH